MKNTELVEKMKQIVKEYKTLYINGCIGAPICKENVERYKKGKSTSRQAKIEAACDTNPLTYGFDCVCLVKSVVFWGWNGSTKKGYSEYGGAKYDSKTDYTIDKLLSLCTDVSDDFTKIEPGEFLYYEGGSHCGIYIGDGLGIEATSKWGDCVLISNVSNIQKIDGQRNRKWLKHGKLPTVDYTIETPIVEAPVETSSETGEKQEEKIKEETKIEEKTTVQETEIVSPVEEETSETIIGTSETTDIEEKDEQHEEDTLVIDVNKAKNIWIKLFDVIIEFFRNLVGKK